MVVALTAEFLQTPDEEAGCLEHRREACRNEAVAILDMLVIVVEKTEEPWSWRRKKVLSPEI